MVGITTYGAYVPPRRLPLAALGGSRGSARPAEDGGPEKAVAWNDEDAVTMAVAAGANCLRGVDRGSIDALLFASTSHPFAEKQGAALIARALDLPRNIQCTDLTGSLRAGTAALRAAADAVAAGSAQRALVVASDCRMGAPGSGLERSGGDAAAAFVIGGDGDDGGNGGGTGTGDVIASLDASHAVADEIVDVWRADGDRFVHSWEDRFVVQQGYAPRLVEAVRGLIDKNGASVTDFQRVLLYGPDARSHTATARALDVSEQQLGDALFGRVGNAGAAAAPLQLAAALETVGAGDRILLANYGDGADAIAFTATAPIEKLAARRGVSWHLERRHPVRCYDDYLQARGLATTEWEAADGPGLSATAHYRDRDSNLSFRGQRCNGCGAVQFPHQRVCETCFAKDDFESIRLSDRSGSLVTYTFDYFFPTPEPPTVVAIVDVDGARLHMQVVNCRPEDVTLGMPLEFELRRVHQVGGRPNYFWKATPRAQEG